MKFRIFPQIFEIYSLKRQNGIIKYLKNFFRKMNNNSDLMPPTHVKNMVALDKEAFTKNVIVPSIIVDENKLSKTIRKSKPFLLKLVKFNSVVTLRHDKFQRQIFLNPVLIKSEEDIETLMKINLKEVGGSFSLAEVTVRYENWKAQDILRAVLPDQSHRCTGFSVIGHILHLNLRDHLIPYKNLIAQVYCDKMPYISLVVNKIDIIDNSDNTFRSFAMEKLAGNSDSTIVTVKENNCTYKFDFSKVYWNPRLSTEHERIIKTLQEGDILFDVMAGVGPFAIPAAKKKCYVYANDLNLESYRSLKENCIINRVQNFAECFNMDGKKFIQTIFKDKFLDIIKSNRTASVHVTMNLPSIAVDFLSSFISLYSLDELSFHNPHIKLPIIHIYLFSYIESKDYVIYSVASKLGYCFKELEIPSDIKVVDSNMLGNNIRKEFLAHIIEVFNVRQVSSSKYMFRLSFSLPKEILFRTSVENTDVQPAKKFRVI